MSALDLLTQVQVCARLGISDETWRTWRKALRTPEAVTMPSGRLKWRVSDIDAMVGRPIERPGRRYFAAARVRHTRTVAATSAASHSNSLTHRSLA